MEFIHQYSTPLQVARGLRYVARAYADRQPGGLWEGWFVFFPFAGGEPLATDRETTQSKRDDLVYWAMGITPTYLEGALQRALEGRPEVRLARRVAQAEREETYARAEAEMYRAAAAEALAQARVAEGERQRAQQALGVAERPGRRPTASPPPAG
jgi:hypothetical protein